MGVSIARVLDARGSTRLAFSPDARTLYYVSQITGTAQLWSVPVDGGMPQRLTFECDRVGAYRGSPDGTRVGYGADEGGDERWSLWVMDVDGGRARQVTDRPDRIHHLVGWDGDALLAFANLRDDRYFDLHSFPVDGGAPRALFRHDGTAFAAAPLSGGRVVVATNRERGDRHHLVLVDPDGSTRRLTPEEPAARHAGAVPFGDDALLVRSDRGRDLTGLVRIGTDGAFTPLVTLAHDVEDHDANDGRFAYSVNRAGFSEVHLVDKVDRVVDGLPEGALANDLIGDSLALASDGALAVSWERYDSPPSVYVARPGEAARLLVPAQMAGLASSELLSTELVSWPTFDGRRIPGFLLQPRGAPSGARPTVIQVHGGPEGQARPLWNPLTVALVTAGCNVLLPNIRGSTGYGRAYQSLDDVRLRLDSVRDLDAGAAWLASEGLAPADRIGVMGGSYGGFMTLAAIAFFPDRDWAAAVDIVGVANFITFFERTAPWRRPLRAAEYGSPETDREFLESISPLNHLQQIRAPLMVIHGANDPRVPVQEADQIVNALRSRGESVEYLRYEDEGHGLAKAKNRADAWPKVVAFFSRHLGL